MVGTFKVNILVAIIASIGVILAAAYILWLYKRVVFGKLENDQLKKIKGWEPGLPLKQIAFGILVNQKPIRKKVTLGR